MARIEVTPEMLREKSTQVRTYKEEYISVIQKLTTLVNGLTDIWQGEAQTTFQGKFEGMKSTFTQFEQILEEYALNLSDAANTYEQAENAVKQRSQG